MQYHSSKDIITIDASKGDLAAIKGYWTGGVWTFVALCHLVLTVGMITRLSVRLPLSVSAAFSIFNILVQEIAPTSNAKTFKYTSTHTRKDREPDKNLEDKYILKTDHYT